MSRGLNKVMIIGNVGREPELRFTSTGKPVTSFSVAVSRRWTDSKGHRREETEWFNVVAWGNLAEICAQFLSKGRQVYVEGRLQTRNWENEQGDRQYRTDIIAGEVTILDRIPGNDRNKDIHSQFDDHNDAVPEEEEDLNETVFLGNSIPLSN